MSDSDHSSSGDAPAKSARSAPLYLVAAIIGAVAIFVFFLIFGSQSKPAAVKPAAIVQPAAMPAAAVAEPEPVIEEPAAIEPEVAEPAGEALPIEAEPQSVDSAIIPADHSGPPWALNLMSLANPDGTSGYLDEIIALGYTPEAVEVNIDGQHWLRVRIKGFPTITAARKAGRHFLGNKDYRTLWIGGY